MNRLSFALQDFTRISWVSEEARNVWEERVSGINKMHSYLEWASVVSGVRECGLQMLDERQLSERPITLRSHGIDLAVLKRVNAVSAYQSRISDATLGADQVSWCVVGATERIAEFRDAFVGSDNATMGRLLGYPECCIEYFQDFWVEQGLIDSTWSSAVNTSSAVMSSGMVTCGATKCSAHLRWIGVRPVFHLPCAINCPKSEEIADQLAGLAQKYQFVNESRWLSELISMPVEWSSLHGIAEIKTPLFKIVTNTDAAAGKHVVRIEGTQYPAEGASGVVFPFQMRQEEPTQRLMSAVEFVELNASKKGKLIEREHYTDNGFTTHYAMERAHSPVVSACIGLLSELTGGERRVLDLGCGNGMLLRRVAEEGSGVAIAGIDCDYQKIERAIDLNGIEDSEFVCGDMFNTEILERQFGSRIGVCILMLGRLSEVPTENAVRLLKWIETSAQKVLVYAYTDYLRNRMSLGSLADELCIELDEITETDSVSLATIDPGKVK
ncbi:MAG: methyltransferase domain-containing protein [Planctomycetaceae bacterium]